MNPYVIAALIGAGVWTGTKVAPPVKHAAQKTGHAIVKVATFPVKLAHIPKD